MEKARRPSPREKLWGVSTEFVLLGVAQQPLLLLRLLHVGLGGESRAQLRAQEGGEGEREGERPLERCACEWQPQPQVRRTRRHERVRLVRRRSSHLCQTCQMPKVPRGGTKGENVRHWMEKEGTGEGEGTTDFRVYDEETET